jgi:hypothetical protein
MWLPVNLISVMNIIRRITELNINITNSRIVEGILTIATYVNYEPVT